MQDTKGHDNVRTAKRNSTDLTGEVVEDWGAAPGPTNHRRLAIDGHHTTASPSHPLAKGENVKENQPLKDRADRKGKQAAVGRPDPRDHCLARSTNLTGNPGN
mmetsp:Transcript_51247/g.85634  ORF Transcript_51247/g.85634 Transcript_51247/m.85634 type:complete len:103 (+) Transcript_51247:743-1051(+)|eukprot:CAMPEP_0174283726 /NCGR_PEP_ID=MMETSP0809-20121228/4447_1 /TAXON_ID=73025 ORGANISM="Eutreptiella gymnastica-like, Strain CCMP1594" /NCGR_SAMPLE_ID=MMETSP0809 /ASSEMBLY_ACC=CAM_ASM_000658 /LENGTH=102 /DNA_ID=CAMNT_0015378845 /DNA_START=733 /DNA_END=1041 /DNA_ORIENTATION=-